MVALGELVAGVAHEINTPMGAVASSQQTITRAVEKLDGLLPPDERKARRVLRILEEAAGVVGAGTARVEAIVTRLRSFARLDQAEVQRASLHHCVEDALAFFAPDLDDRIAIVRDIAETPPVECSPVQINQLLLNLLMNAREAIDGQGTITVRTGVDGGAPFASVSDDGRGIPEALRSKVFDPGFTTKGVRVGTGLGLSICYQIATEHRGSIEVESEEGVGSTFTLRLPVPATGA